MIWLFWTYNQSQKSSEVKSCTSNFEKKPAVFLCLDQSLFFVIERNIKVCVKSGAVSSVKRDRSIFLEEGRQGSNNHYNKVSSYPLPPSFSQRPETIQNMRLHFYMDMHSASFSYRHAPCFIFIQTCTLLHFHIDMQPASFSYRHAPCFIFISTCTLLHFHIDMHPSSFS